MKTIFLMRHAKSSWSTPGQGDFDRPLNERGRDACARMVQYFKGEAITPDVVLCSGAERTRETLSLLSAAIPTTATILFDDALYLASPQTILNKISALDDSSRTALVIAHYPGIQECALALGAHDPHNKRPEIYEKFPTGALVHLSATADAWRDVSTDKGQILGFVRPKTLPPNNIE